MEDQKPVSIGEADFTLDNGNSISGIDIPNAVMPSVRVFNREFVAATVKAIGESSVEPIYYLGEGSIEKQNQIEQLKVDLENSNGILSSAISEKQKAVSALDSFCIKQGKHIKEVLRGSDEHANYDKNRFKAAITKLKSISPQTVALSHEEKEQYINQKNLHAKKDIAPIKTLVISLVELRSRVSTYLEKTIVSQVLEELKTGDRVIGEWVHRGLLLHKGDHQSDTCRFCGNEFSAKRREELEGHFNDAFASFQNEVDQLVTDIKGYRDTVERISLPDAARFYEHLSQDAIPILDAVGPEADAVVGVFDSFEKALTLKKSAPFEALTLETSEPEEVQIYSVLQDRIDEINRVIRTHNDTTKNLNKQIKLAYRALESDYILDSLPEFNQLDDALLNAIKASTTAEKKPVELKEQIKAIEKDIIEHRRPAEELTLELRNYLGRDELEFEVKSTGYSLNRGSEPAHHLSEGERTAIAFLYFLKSLEDKDFDISKGVVVIDDPVSSLDANALFSAFGYMKDRTKNCYQLFILTHNFMFFRQVKNWFHHMKGQNKKKIELRPARFYMLSSEIVNSKRNAVLAPMDRLLEEFESEYHYLFKQVNDVANYTSEKSELSQYYGMPNIGRRLIETFLAYRFPDIGGNLSKQFDRVHYDAAKKTRILRFLHTYSHSGGIAEPEHDPSILSDTKQVMLELLELIKAVDINHYNGMMMLLQPPDEED